MSAARQLWQRMPAWASATTNSTFCIRVQARGQGSAQGPIWLGLGLLSPSDSGVAPTEIGLLLGLGLWGKKSKNGLLLGLGLQSPKVNRTPPWTRTLESKGKSDSYLDPERLWSPRPVGLWFGLGLLVCSGLGFCGRVPPLLSQPALGL
jgi:hypothetical protein